MISLCGNKGCRLRGCIVPFEYECRIPAHAVSPPPLPQKHSAGKYGSYLISHNHPQDTRGQVVTWHVSAGAAWQMCHDRHSRDVGGQQVHADFISSSFWNVIDSEPTEDYCDPRVLRGNEKSILLKRRSMMFLQSSSPSPRYRAKKKKKRAFDGFKGGNLFWKSKPRYFHFMLNFRKISHFPPFVLNS